jgi:hypothetical protein
MTSNPPADPSNLANPARPADRSTRSPVDPRGPRFSALITAVLLLLVVFLSLTGASGSALTLLAALTALFAWGAFAGVGRHPFGVLFRRVVRPHLSPPAELEAPEPPTFAQGVGLVVTAVGVVLGLAGMAPACSAAPPQQHPAHERGSRPTPRLHLCLRADARLGWGFHTQEVTPWL